MHLLEQLHHSFPLVVLCKAHNNLLPGEGGVLARMHGGEELVGRGGLVGVGAYGEYFLVEAGAVCCKRGVARCVCVEVV